MTMKRALVLLKRGLSLRCPVCGEGRLFRSWFQMHERCPECNFRYEREEGYFSSSMALNLIISELLIAAFTVPLAADPQIPLTQIFLWGWPVPILLPLLLYHHSRSMWMSMDHLFHPIERTTI